MDSLITLIEQVKDEDQQVKLIMNIYNTKVEANPLLVIETAQRLSVIAQKTKNQIMEACSWAFFGRDTA